MNSAVVKDNIDCARGDMSRLQLLLRNRIKREFRSSGDPRHRSGPRQQRGPCGPSRAANGRRGRGGTSLAVEVSDQDIRLTPSRARVSVCVSAAILRALTL